MSLSDENSNLNIDENKTKNISKNTIYDKLPKIEKESLNGIINNVL